MPLAAPPSVGAAAALAVLALLAAAALAAAALTTACLLVARPWDPRRRDYSRTHALPRPLFAAVAWWLRLCEEAAGLKPAPHRVAELANSYLVLFALCELGIPDALRRLGGEATASEVASEAALRADARWADRLLSAAAEFGLLRCARRCSRGRRRGAAPGPPERAYALNAVSAVLCADAPCCMRDFVLMERDQAEGALFLAEGIRRGAVPFELSPASKGGAGFWAALAADERRAAAFDGAMRAVDHFAGAPVTFDRVVDIAGGTGHFLARLLRRCPRLRGTLFDQPAQIARAREWWGQEQPDLICARASFAAGSFFEAAALPGPATGSDAEGRTAFVLRNILHDWDDEAALAILRALRARVDPAPLDTRAADAADAAPAGSSAAPARGGDGAGGRGSARSGGGGGSGRERWRDATLVIVEATLSEAVLPSLAKHRACSDITMLCNFGGGQERDEAAFSALLAAAGWRLRRVRPSAGFFCVLDAVPA
ncbi:hypothetical protein Rsub_04317 [Raphidocelis subcapitata]|uniref:Uncharacterized protein n=1 Tax=Raphidocelis subcapitata TaxID=307507 RepID=A0A2V0P2Z8_9CHLO|nr:hypothetical protein Rsub_04317 [Raphidocelis subcapitata]|eukprot:GBF91577.1 hypothetical protein Rsub_04317 [Raphidocelis subcapitata]